jgi:hypothetical protein
MLFFVQAVLLPGVAHAADPPTSGEEIEVRQLLTVEEARAATYAALATEGYSFAGRRGSFVVFHGDADWKPEVLLHDDGWILVGWGDKRKPAEHIKAEVYSATADAVRALNDAVAARALHARLTEEIPAELRAIWERRDLDAAARRALLFAWWDGRTDTPEGDAARVVAETFLTEVVQRSDTPFPAAELAALNARRRSRHALEL